ncbi:nitrate/nitrite transporter NrtS [Romeria aff. gracilis LEGE 07310]|uniref:Nitrate/nitrite transporter NrtS n=2 Tax=Vasconcelosia TaxID=3366328 RepID=A0A8J7DDT8_9CYAN|nr:nitrate/nitrite transporter NrtS [Romeria aff. gracilis LEGE 07310]
MSEMKEYIRSLVNPEMAPTGIRVALIVGSALFAINHGNALMHNRMQRSRWISGAITYIVPYMVNIHGQYSNHRRDQAKR